ncbi:hypothetical protein HELRODRAFT_194679 [Helobdella robusta]|uniref:Sortilin-related receptor n=1 Tax=Helobdella robusta TaxID=6412 RepID=T1FWB1_HELRO|nr:hypothetical protein HELRODRAFT_194679 [Helobdella robusta]ESN90112.1 hypothetical protein HELRODRAFT_194679 [Helobdella robusta]
MAELNNNFILLFRGLPEYGDHSTEVYVQTYRPSAVLKINYDYSNRPSNFTTPPSSQEVQLLTDVRDFQVVKEFLVGTVNKDIYVADATEHQLFVVVVLSSTNSTNLFISDSSGLYYTLSLNNIFFYSPHGMYNNTWLRFYATKPLAELYRVDGLNGVYIATTIINTSLPLRPYADNNQQTFITFNKGVDWKSIRAPYERPVCTNSTGCNITVHLAQMYNSLMPLARTQPILSSKSAPGILIGSGNVGASLTGNYDVFLSNDGGLVWRRVLNGTFYFTMGDHGGIIVAVKMQEPTNYIVYSLNEGASWSFFEFSSTRINVYALTTEPGEETGVFTIFGSNSQHLSWVIIQVNLSSAFNRTCVDSDYYSWNPTDDPNIDCLLGKKMIYQRRKSLSLCYNGRNYDRAINVQNCPCKISDYECDYGYTRNKTTQLCELRSFEWSSFVCAFGYDLSYNRSKGYKRIPSDTCEGGMQNVFDPVLTNCPVTSNGEFIMFSNMSAVFRYSYARRSVVKIHLSSVQQNILSIAYDYQNDCLFFADTHYDNIQMICLRGEKSRLDQRVLMTQQMDRIESMSYNWVTKMLFWLDAGNKRIECMKVSNQKRRVVISRLLQPKSLVLHPKKGYMFWSDWTAVSPGIFRSSIAGSDMKMIVDKSKANIKWPSGLTIDYSSSRLYFVDGSTNSILYCDFDGVLCLTLLQSSTWLSHPFSAHIYKNTIVWADLQSNYIYSMNKNDGTSPVRLLQGYSNVVNLLALNTQSQTDTSSCSSQSACRDANALCFETSNTTYECRCSIEFIESSPPLNTVCGCPSGTQLINQSCVATDFFAIDKNHEFEFAANHDCPNEFTCPLTRRCIPLSYVCDHDNDCGDMSDEMNCSFSCTSSQFQCSNGRCISSRWLCDGDDDCQDMSDELPTNCHLKDTNCTSTQFRCDSGRCISSSFKCDFDDDCHDGSDERDCTYLATTPSTLKCQSTEFQCQTIFRCIPSRWRCDGDSDCSDGSDEENCQFVNCSAPMFRCDSASKCLRPWKKCDGMLDCNDGTDELGCTAVTTVRPFTPSSTPFSCNLGFECKNIRQCIFWSQVCNGVNDCLDRTDEINCENCQPPSRFRCRNGGCVSSSLKCNFIDDCGDNSDEQDCDVATKPPTCPPMSIRCEGSVLQCVTESSICDGVMDCLHGDDEDGCTNASTNCLNGYFSCLFIRMCINASKVCDGKEDCLDASDELNCKDAKVPEKINCTSSYFSCEHGGCVRLSNVCDEKWDCVDGSDEDNCLHNWRDYTPTWQITNSTFCSVTFEVSKISNVTVSPSSPVLITATVGTTDWSDYQANITSVKSLPASLVFNKLRPQTRYILTLNILLNRMKSHPSVIEFITPDESAFSAPTNLTYKILSTVFDDMLLRLSWNQPMKDEIPYVIQYRVDYVDITTNQLINSQTRSSQFTTNTWFEFTTDHLIYGHKYKFQVYSRHTQWSVGSRAIEIQFGTKCFHLQETSSSSPATTSSTFSFDLQHSLPMYAQSYLFWWSYDDNVKAYIHKVKITRESDDDNSGVDDLWRHGDSGDVALKSFYERDVSHNVGVRWDLTGLSPASKYLVEVSIEEEDTAMILPCLNKNFIINTALAKDASMMEPLMFSVAQQGDGRTYLTILSDLGQMTSHFDEVEIKIYYFVISTAQLKTFYEVVDLSHNNDNKHDNVSLRLDVVPKCEMVCYRMRLVWPFRNKLSKVLCYNAPDDSDPLSPPKHVRVLTSKLNPDRTFVTVSIAWKPPCMPSPMNYLIMVDEMEVDTSQLMHVNFSSGIAYRDDKGLSELNFELGGLKRGSTYGISVRRDKPVGRLSERVTYLAAPLNLSCEQIDSEEVFFILRWNEPIHDLPNSYVGISLMYEIFYSPTYRLLGDLSIFTLMATTSKTFHTIKKENMKLDNSFKVRITTADLQHKSNFSEIVTVHVQGNSNGPKSSSSTSSSRSNLAFYISIPLVAITLLLLTSLIIYACKYKRLRNSFNQFTRSRYNSETNTAILSDLGKCFSLHFSISALNQFAIVIFIKFTLPKMIFLVACVPL